MLQEYRISESRSQRFGQMEVEKEMVWKLQNCIKLEERLLLRVKYFKIKGACKSLGKKYLKKIMLNKKEYANGQKILR